MEKQNKRLIQRALRNESIAKSVFNAHCDHGKESSEWTIDELLKEAQYLADKYDDGGCDQFDSLHSSDPYERKDASSEYGKLCRLCIALSA